MFETYFFLFIDTLFAALVLPIRSEMVLPAMVEFGGYNSYLIFVTALLASVIGLMINWQIGKYLPFFKNSKTLLEKKKELKKIADFWNKYVVLALPLLLPFAFVSAVGSVVCLFSGFFQTRFLKFFTLILVGKVIYLYNLG